MKPAIEVRASVKIDAAEIAKLTPKPCRGKVRVGPRELTGKEPTNAGTEG